MPPTRFQTLEKTGRNVPMFGKITALRIQTLEISEKSEGL
jgi:hypothetical protein